MISTLGHTTKLTGNPYRAFATTLLSETTDRGPQLIAVPNGKKVKDWAIRSQAPKSDMNFGSNTKVYDKDMGKVQRLDDCGSEGINHPR